MPLLLMPRARRILMHKTVLGYRWSESAFQEQYFETIILYLFISGRRGGGGGQRFPIIITFSY